MQLDLCSYLTGSLLEDSNINSELTCLRLSRSIYNEQKLVRKADPNKLQEDQYAVSTECGDV